MLVCIPIRTSIESPFAFTTSVPVLVKAHHHWSIPTDLASNGEIQIDKAKRGYDISDNSEGQLMWYNPFYMKYTPDEEGNFNDQIGYGYISFEKFVDAVRALKEGEVTLDELDRRDLPTLRNTVGTMAVLEAGRRSLDELRAIEIVEAGHGLWVLK